MSAEKYNTDVFTNMKKYMLGLEDCKGQDQ